MKVLNTRIDGAAPDIPIKSALGIMEQFYLDQIAQLPFQDLAPILFNFLSRVEPEKRKALLRRMDLVVWPEEITK